MFYLSRHGENRKPKLFYVSTQVNTFTFTTNSVCVQSSTASLAACTKKRKRQMDMVELDGLDEFIVPR